MSELTPITRDEKFLDGAAQGSAEGLPVPILREEKYLAKAAGMDLDALGIEIPEPEDRVEEYLNALAEGSGGGGKNATFGNTPADFTVKANLISVVVPEGVTSIGTSCFQNCNTLTDVSLPESLTAIGQSAFVNCKELTTLTVPASVTDIKSYAFTGCTKLETITINKAEGSISGAPWGAPNTTQIVWTG